MYLLIVIFCIVFLGNLCWYVFVFRNSYAIITPGLKPIYNVFIVHLISTLIFLVLATIGPVLSTYWNTDALCHIYGKYIGCILTFHHFLITLFSYSNIQLYDELSRGRFFCYKCASVFGSVGMFLWCIVMVVQVIVSDSGPAYSNGTTVCFEPNKYYYTTCVLSFLLLVLLNTMFIVVICVFGDGGEYDIPELKYQLRINKTIVPLIWSSTVFSYIAFLVMAPNLGNNGVWILFWSFVDNILNSMVMYWAIFGMGQNTEFMDATAERRGFVYFMGSCQSSEDLAVKLEAMGWSANEEADDRSSGAGRAVYFETHEYVCV